MPDPQPEIVGFWVAGEVFCAECAMETRKDTGQAVIKGTPGWAELECTICGVALIELIQVVPCDRG